MRIFVAGASGAIGRPLVRRLIQAGHEVTGTTRSADAARELRAEGVAPIQLDVFDTDAVRRAVGAATPEVLVHQLTALPKDVSPGALRASLAMTARLRRETVPTFMRAAREVGARRCVVQSISFVTPPEGPPTLDETTPLWRDPPAELRETIASVRALEGATTGEPGVEGLVLRYGFFYGPGTWYAPDGTIGQMVKKRAYPRIGDGRGLASFIHIDDAVEATVLALTRGEPGVYNVTDDAPASQNEWLPEIARLLGAKPPRRVPAWLARIVAGATAVHYATTLRGASSKKAILGFGWKPRPWREGFREVFGSN